MYRLGIDIGSTTIKMALIKVESQMSKDRPSDSKPVVLATDYRRHNAEPMKVGQEMIEGILQRSGLHVRLPADVPRPALANRRPSARVRCSPQNGNHPHGQKDP